MIIEEIVNRRTEIKHRIYNLKLSTIICIIIFMMMTIIYFYIKIIGRGMI